MVTSEICEWDSVLGVVYTSPFLRRDVEECVLLGRHEMYFFKVLRQSQRERWFYGGDGVRGPEVKSRHQ